MTHYSFSRPINALFCTDTPTSPIQCPEPERVVQQPERVLPPGASQGGTGAEGAAAVRGRPQGQEAPQATDRWPASPGSNRRRQGVFKRSSSVTSRPALNSWTD